MQRTIRAVFEDGVFKPLEKVELGEGTRLNITLEGDVIALAKKFSGIGGYQGKIDADKLHRIEADIFG